MSYLAIALAFSSAAAAPATATTVSPDPLDKVKCVRENVTGSLVSTRKVCHTIREWRRISDDAQDESRRIRQPGTNFDTMGQ